MPLVELTDGNRKSTRFEAKVAADDPEAFEVEFPLEYTGTYQLRFVSKRGDEYRDPQPYEMIADSDNPPHRVELTKPRDRDEVRANGRVLFEGVAEDDIGVKSITLKGRVVDGPQFKDRPYRSDAELALPSGGYMKKLEYKDHVDLRTIQD